MRNRQIALQKLVRSLEGKTLLVEGKHDIRALKEIGADAVFVTTNGSPEAIARKLGGAKKVFLMLDFDREGLRKQSFFKSFLEEQGFSVDAMLARKMRAILGFTHVEEVERKYADLKKKGEFDGENVR